MESCTRYADPDGGRLLAPPVVLAARSRLAFRTEFRNTFLWIPAGNVRADMAIVMGYDT
jgi:hypothetical protein